MYLLWWVYYSSPKRVTDLFGRACICCGGLLSLRGVLCIGVNRERLEIIKGVGEV